MNTIQFFKNFQFLIAVALWAILSFFSLTKYPSTEPSFKSPNEVGLQLLQCSRGKKKRRSAFSLFVFLIRGTFSTWLFHKVSYKWNHVTCNLSCLSSFTWHNVFDVYSCCVSEVHVFLMTIIVHCTYGQNTFWICIHHLTSIVISLYFF